MPTKPATPRARRPRRDRRQEQGGEEAQARALSAPCQPPPAEHPDRASRSRRSRTGRATSGSGSSPACGPSPTGSGRRPRSPGAGSRRRLPQWPTGGRGAPGDQDPDLCRCRRRRALPDPQVPVGSRRPCEISAAKECAPSTTRSPRAQGRPALCAPDGEQLERGIPGDLHDQLANFAALLQSDTSSLASPWPGDGPGERVLAVGEGRPRPDRSPRPKRMRADAASWRGRHRQGRPNPPSLSGRQAQAGEGGDATLSVTDGLATRARRRGPVRRRARGRGAFAAGRPGPRLEGSDQDVARSELPDVRLAELYLSRAGISRLLAGRPGSATQRVPSSTTAPRPAWPPRCEPATTGWR